MNITPLTSDHLIPWSHLLAICFGRKAGDMAELLRFLQPEARLVAWGAWDGEILAAQYSCWLTAVHHPGCDHALPVGMSVNMAVHPAYRGRGLIKQVAEPVYASLVERGAVAGVGFSNAQGVQVDRRSKGYGYEVVGQLRPSLFYLGRRLTNTPFRLTTQWPSQPFAPVSLPENHCFHHTPESLQHRFGQHPFRQYHFGVWAQENKIVGLVVYRQARLGPFPLITLLAAHSQDMVALCAQWLAAMRQQHFRLVHVLTSPTSRVLDALRVTAVPIPIHHARTPYYLTLKPLSPAMPASLRSFTAWDCVGGDVL